MLGQPRQVFPSSLLYVPHIYDCVCLQHCVFGTHTAAPSMCRCACLNSQAFVCVCMCVCVSYTGLSPRCRVSSSPPVVAQLTSGWQRLLTRTCRGQSTQWTLQQWTMEPAKGPTARTETVSNMRTSAVCGWTREPAKRTGLQCTLGSAKACATSTFTVSAQSVHSHSRRPVMCVFKPTLIQP